MYRTVIPEEGKTKWALSCYTTLLPRERFQAVVKGGGTQTELSSLADLKKQSMQLGEAKATRVYRTEYRRGKSYTKSSETYSGIAWHCWIMTCHMWENYQGQEKNHKEAVKWNNHHSSHRTRNSSCSGQQD